VTLNTRQVSFYMAQRNKGLTQEAAAATTGISVRSGRRIEKGQWQSSGERHWRTRQDPLEAVWLSDVLPLLASRPQISPTRYSRSRSSSGHCSAFCLTRLFFLTEKHIQLSLLRLPWLSICC